MSSGRWPLPTRTLVPILLAAFTVFTNVNLLLPVIPLYVRASGGGDFLAGLATTALMLTTVAAQVATPRVLGRLGYPTTLVAGLVLVGAPTLFYAPAGTPRVVLAITLLRGLGFGVATVAFAALVADLAPPGRQGEAIGLYGIASTLPGVFGLPSGLWLISRVGFGAVFVLGAAVTLFGVAGVLGARVRAASPAREPTGFLSGMGRGPLRRPFFVFLATTVAAGVIVTFLPLAAPEKGIGSAAAALLLWGLIQTAARWWAGRYSDRFGAYRLIAPSLVLAALGMLAIGQIGSAPLLLLGAALNGLGFGVLQNAAMSVLVGRVPRSEYGLVSTLWNVGFDAGAGFGPLPFGLLAMAAGYAAAFAAAAVPILASLTLVYAGEKGRSGA